MQGAFANSELPTGEQTVMAGLPEEDEPNLMPFGFAVHDESFFRVPEWHGLQVRLQTCDATAIVAPRPILSARAFLLVRTLFWSDMAEGLASELLDSRL